METITTQITDENIIYELPDISIVDILYNENSTVDTFKQFFNNSLTRKKFQSLLEYKVDNNVLTSLRQKLAQAFVDQYNADENKEEGTSASLKDNNVVIKKGDVEQSLYIVNINKFGNGIFTNSHFTDTFFTTDVLDEIFNQKDKYFNLALFRIEKFWDILLTNDDLLNHFIETYPNEFRSAYMESEIGYVKIAIKKAGLSIFDKFSSVKLLASRVSVFTEILSSDESERITKESPFGVKAEVLYYGGFETIADTLQSSDMVTKVDEDDELRKAIEHTSILTEGGDAPTYNTAPVNTKILSNPKYIGELIFNTFNENADGVTYTQIIYNSDYNDIFKKMLTDKTLSEIVLSSSLTDSINVDVVDKIRKISGIKSNVMTYKTDDNKFNIVFTDKNKTLKQSTLSFPDASSTNFKINCSPVNDNYTNKSVSLSPVYINANNCGALRYFRTIFFSDDSLENMFPEFVQKIFTQVYGMGTHLYSIDLHGKIYSNKFGLNNVNVGDIKNVRFKEDLILVEGSDSVYATGKFNYNEKDIVSTITTKKDDIKDLYIVDHSVIAIGNDNSVNEIAGTNMISSNILDDYKLKDTDGNTTESVTGNGITDMFESLGTIYVLDGKNKLWFKNGSNIVTVEDVKEIIPSGDAVEVVPTTGDNYIYITNGEAVRKYEYTVNF